MTKARELGDLTNKNTIKNIIINGNFNVWQRGTSFSSIGYTADRFSLAKNGSVAINTTQSTSVPTLNESNTKSNYSLRMEIATAQPSLGAGDYLLYIYSVEGFDYAVIDNKTVTLSFWVKATKTGTNSISFRSGGFNRTYVAEYTINVADTWEKKSITLPLNDSANGTWNFDNTLGMDILFCMGVGTTFSTSTLNAWQAGNFLGSTNQVNHADTVTNNFSLAQVQLEIGNVETDFSDLLISETVKLCQRYFCKSFDLTQTPVQNLGASSNGVVTQIANVGGASHANLIFPQEMRTSPTITTYGPSFNNGNWNRSDGGNGAITSVTAIGTARAKSLFSNGSGNFAYDIHFTADAEL